MSRNERIEKWLIPWAALFSGLYLGYSVSWKMENDGVRAIMTETYTRLHNDASFMEQCESMKASRNCNSRSAMPNVRPTPFSQSYTL